MSDGTIDEIETVAELREAYPIIEQLRPIGEEKFLELVDEMRGESGYQLYGLRDENGSLVAVAGFVRQTNLYNGSHVWVHDLVVDESVRGNGYGSRLLTWIFDWADERDCSCVELASGLWREDAHRFYDHLDMEKYCYTFQKSLSTESPY